MYLERGELSKNKVTVIPFSRFSYIFLQRIPTGLVVQIPLFYPCKDVFGHMFYIFTILESILAIILKFLEQGHFDYLDNCNLLAWTGPRHGLFVELVFVR